MEVATKSELNRPPLIVLKNMNSVKIDLKKQLELQKAAYNQSLANNFPSAYATTSIPFNKKPPPLIQMPPRNFSQSLLGPYQMPNQQKPYHVQNLVYSNYTAQQRPLVWRAYNEPVVSHQAISTPYPDLTVVDTTANIKESSDEEWHDAE